MFGGVKRVGGAVIVVLFVGSCDGLFGGSGSGSQYPVRVMVSAALFVLARLWQSATSTRRLRRWV